MPQMAVKIGSHGREETGTTTMGAIRKATEANQLRLQTLELAVAHLTNICIGLKDEVSSLRSILLETGRIKGDVKESVMDMKLPYHSSSSSVSSDSKNDLGAKKVRRQPWKKDAKIIPAIKVQAAGRKARRSMSPIKAAGRTSQKGSSRSTTPGKLRPAMSTMRAKASIRLKPESRRVSENVIGIPEGLKKPARKADDAKSVAVDVKDEGKTSAKSVTVKLPLQMADAPTIRSLIYGSRNASVVKSTGAQRPVIAKKRT